MDGSSTPKRKWVLTSEALARFLACLDADTERAGERYEMIRLALVKFFDWRRAHTPEELADETLNRAIRRVDEGDIPADLPSYCLGIARFVLRESLRRPEQRGMDLEEAGPLPAPAADELTEDARQSCFESCLHELPVESRHLIMQYYQDERRQKINNRLALAERMGIPLNALRSRAQRIRNRLEQCVADCQKKNVRAGGMK
ncbi:MAG: sigma-70 family RNA polymerase sigma factor [Acidobacteria bacterium]|nr:sigma-70 family RNA polymerase sigma factor [Acidobacteriota bacterium]MBI3424957.1 sigma-70 family RNA polymerase sigma factor [Acidobacteriota bacterium]